MHLSIQFFFPHHKIFRYKLSVLHKIYIFSSTLAALGGGLMVILIGHITPEDTAYWTRSGEFVFVAILSGSLNVFAPLIGSLFFEFIRSYALFYFPNTWQMIIGVVLILGILYLPEGIGSIFNKRKKYGFILFYC